MFKRADSKFRLEACGNDFLVPIPFSLPSNHSHSHSHPFPFQHCIPIPIFPITSIPGPTHYRSHFGQRLYIDYLKAQKYVYCVANSKQKTKLQQKHCNQSRHLSVTIIIIITVTANHCSLFTVQRLSDCHCLLLRKKRRLFTLPVDNDICRFSSGIFQLKCATFCVMINRWIWVGICFFLPIK